MGLLKRCSKCHKTKKRTSFYKRASGTFRKECKQCRIEAAAKWAKRNQQIVTKVRKAFHRRNPIWQKNYDLKRNYDITIGIYEQLLFEQDLVCAICRRISGTLHVDHDHQTGEVRGLLCTKCNLGIGCFVDDPERLLAAAIYLEQLK
jgi:hypothetical protein